MRFEQLRWLYIEHPRQLFDRVYRNGINLSLKGRDVRAVDPGEFRQSLL